MTLGSKEMADENKESDSVHDKNTNTNGVVITVYVESVKTRKTRPHPHFIRPRVSETEGYDRRAQLLAHSRQLRNQGSENVPLPSNQSQTIIKSKQQKGIRLTQSVSCSCSRSRRRRNERVASEVMSIERNQSKKKKSNGKKFLPIMGKVKSMLKELSCKEI